MWKSVQRPSFTCAYLPFYSPSSRAHIYNTAWMWLMFMYMAILSIYLAGDALYTLRLFGFKHPQNHLYLHIFETLMYAAIIDGSNCFYSERVQR